MKRLDRLTLSLLALILLVTLSATTAGTGVISASGLQSSFPTVLGSDEPPSPPPLFSAYAGGAPDGYKPTDNLAVQQSRFVTVDFDLLASSDQLLLNMFDPPNEVSYPATRDGVKGRPPNNFRWFGQIDTEINGKVILVVKKGDVLVGNIVTDQGIFQIRYAGDSGGASVHIIRHMDESALPPHADPLPVDSSTSQEPSTLAATAVDDGSVIDVMVVYTAEARSAEGGTAAMEALIDLAVEETNSAFTSSLINSQLRLVHTAEVNYTESGDMVTDVSRLRSKTDGYMDEVHSWRDTYNADQITLIEKSTQYCGVAYLMSSVSSSFASSAFSTVSRVCATGYYSFGHELGHNLGSHHDRDHASGSPAYAYSYGYQAPDKAYRTIMAYNAGCNCSKIQNFSNPSVSVAGQPTGIDYDSNPSSSADNARSINNTAYTVANFRVSGDTPPAQPPVPPSGLSATTISSANISLAWTDNSDDENGFEIERSLDGANWGLIATVGQDTIAYSDGDLSAGTTYYYQVRSYNDAGSSSFSNVAEAPTEEPLVMPPDGLTATAISTAEIDLQWTDNSGDEEEFLIERSAGNTKWALIATVGANVTVYHDSGLSSGTTYSYRVQSKNASGSSPYSNVADATTLEAVPIAPSNLIASGVSASQIDLSWTDRANNEDGFLMERSLDGTTWSQVADVGVNQASYSDTSLSPSTTYYHRVRAYNGTTNSPYSNVDSAATLDGISLTANGYKKKGKHYVELAWSGSQPSEVEISRNGKVIAKLKNTGSFTDSIGKRGKGTYTYQACDAASSMLCSNEVTVKF